MTRAALRRGAERIVAVGGDGTVHEVVNGFFEEGAGEGRMIAPDAVFAHLPCGTGGDFRRALGVPSGRAAARLLRSDRTRRVDLMRVTCRTSTGRASQIVANVSSCGLGGDVVQSVRSLPSAVGARLGPVGGSLAYFVAILRRLATSAPGRVQVTVDGRDAGTFDTRTVAVANGSSLGGGLHLAPQAVVDDGVLDVVVVGDLPVSRLLACAPRFYRGTHLSLPGIHVFRGRRITLEPPSPPGSAPPTWLEGDGELLGHLPATFEVLPGALRTVSSEF
jgi:YegS/Rv2252/BmrU family lipid kinase